MDYANNLESLQSCIVVAVGLKDLKKRNNLVHKKRMGESLMVDIDEVNQCKEVFQSIVEEQGYLPEQVFNCDETGLIWKRKKGASYVCRMKPHCKFKKLS